MAKKNGGLAELLDLLRAEPSLCSALVFDSESIERFLVSKKAKELALGANVRKFLTKVARPGGGIGVCLDETAVLCPRTDHVHALDCPGGTDTWVPPGLPPVDGLRAPKIAKKRLKTSGGRTKR